MATVAESVQTIDYPSSDGQPMAETGIHVNAIFFLFGQLQEYYAAREDVYLAADMFWYWQKGKPKRRVAPDIMVIPGVPKEPERRSFFSWEEGAIPSLVIEYASEGTWKADVGRKFRLYQRLGVREYVIFDPEALYINPSLQCHRLHGTKYRRVRLKDSTFQSELGFGLKRDGTLLRMIDSKSGERILTGYERGHAEHQRAEAEKQRAEAEKQRAEAEKSRADKSESEVERLKAILQKYGHAGRNGS